MYPPQTLNVSYGTSSSVVLNVPTGVSYADFVTALMRRGFWIPQNRTANSPATVTFVPAGSITLITGS